MLKIKTVTDLQNTLQKIRSTACKIGLVPTMGALHQGHLSLVKKSIAENHFTLVTIFINPTQFNATKDLEKYPQNLPRDFDLLQKVGCSAVFIPSIKEMYHGNVTAKKYDFGMLTQHMEGRFRSGHFEGVATIVEKLFLLVEADVAYFGEKDFQQLQVIKKVACDLPIKTKITPCETRREANGLAMSSRNELLSVPIRKDAKIIYQTLCRAKEKFRGGDSPFEIKNFVAKVLKKTGFALEYFEIADAENCTPITEKDDRLKNIRGFIAVVVEGVRLIDNIAFSS